MVSEHKLYSVDRINYDQLMTLMTMLKTFACMF